ncbi:Acylglycerol lipase [Purpureocillium takamizusanense]|uniref:Acylglycerol lipase n=1 Tax=Purpureocillium takamizusanense TaxID=2060973 RepID=A0A9Q8QIY1_9HYPO|nr:Acylglycerol lipase [Purpureocillium takamizusanense]UNI19681.1 Acylglycerol lipase [Purpureocillium takamizusanense]
MPSSTALDALGHAVSGSAGTAISTAAVFPLDLVTTRLKVQRRRRDQQEQYDGVVDALRGIARSEGGVSALYNGLGPDVAKSVVDSFLFFGFYSYLRGRNRHPSVVQELLMGSLAGACSKACTTPISSVVTRMQMSSGSETLREMLADIRRESGVLGLWSGYSATLILTLNPSLTFFVNRRLAKRVLPALEEEDIPIAWAAFLLAAFSKAAATALTYPFQTGRTRLQIPSETPAEEASEKDKGLGSQQKTSLLGRLLEFLDKTVIGVIFRIVKREGLRALYDGLQGELLKGFFSHGLTMLTKGLLHRLVIRLWVLSRPHLRKRLQGK